MAHLKPIGEMEKTLSLNNDGSFSVTLQEKQQPQLQPQIIVEMPETPIDKHDEKAHVLEKPHKIAEHARAIGEFFALHAEQYLEPRMITDLSNTRISKADALTTIRAICRDHPELSAEQQKRFAQKVLERVEKT
jgi:hypothetical protein